MDGSEETEGGTDGPNVESHVHELMLTLSAHLDEPTDLTDFTDGKEADPQEIYSRLHKNPQDASTLYNELKEFFETDKDDHVDLEEIKEAQGDIPEEENLRCEIERADACKILPSNTEDSDLDGENLSLPENSVDLIITSPPYWQKRNYGVEDQLGQEDDSEKYVDHLIDTLDRWEKFLRPTGSIFLNLGDTYHRKSLVEVPGLFARKAREAGWTIRNEITWAKTNGIPSPAKDRLVPRHEPIYHLVRDDDYFYDLFGYSKVYGNGSNPGDVWKIAHDRNTGGHLAPFPEELVQRILTLACPPAVCPECGEPQRRELERPLLNLDQSRPQARRALKKFHDSDLNKDHIRAIRAVGISDAGKAKEFQSGAGNNAEDVQELADEAKNVLGGYFREFTFPQPETKDWVGCDCEVDPEPGVVFDPFAGSGTTLKVANELGYHAWGTDLDTSNFQKTVQQFN
jgi:DNA modification methylase